MTCKWRAGAWREIARSIHYTRREPYWAAQQAFPYADLAARSS